MPVPHTMEQDLRKLAEAGRDNDEIREDTEVTANPPPFTGAQQPANMVLCCHGRPRTAGSSPTHDQRDVASRELGWGISASPARHSYAYLPTIVRSDIPAEA